MAPKQKITISPGDKLGSLTVLSESGRTKHGHLQYLVRCDCGNEYIIPRSGLMRDFPKCQECMENTKKPPNRYNTSHHHFWECAGNWILLEEPYPGNNKTLQAEAMCLSCGNTSVIYPAGAKFRKGFRCSKCPPEYYFKMQGNIAVGVLPDGTSFQIDAKDVARVSQHYWHTDRDGYIISADEKPAIKLHNFILGFKPSENKGRFVDHIDRDISNCTKHNLRVVTYQQNSMNTSIIRSSSTGLRGVTFDKSRGRYIARIGLNDKRIYLGSSPDPIKCAQMYNWAAPIIFGEFAGELNDVPDPPAWLKHEVEERCNPYILEAAFATHPCGDFL